jgi:hypothetical protein
MDQLAHQDIAAAAAVHTELGHEYHDAVAEGLVEKISSEIDKQVDARLAQRGVQLALQPSQTPWASVAMGLGSVGLGVAATAVTLHSMTTGGAVPKASIDLGTFRASLMTSTSSVSTAAIVLIVLIWAVIAVVNVAYARRHLGRAKLLFLTPRLAGASGWDAPDQDAGFGLLQPPAFGLFAPVVVAAERRVLFITTHVRSNGK